MVNNPNSLAFAHPMESCDVISVGTEILVDGRWIPVEDADAQKFLKPWFEAVRLGMPGASDALTRFMAIAARPRVIVKR